MLSSSVAMGAYSSEEYEAQCRGATEGKLEGFTLRKKMGSALAMEAVRGGGEVMGDVYGRDELCTWDMSYTAGFRTPDVGIRLQTFRDCV